MSGSVTLLFRGQTDGTLLRLANQAGGFLQVLYISENTVKGRVKPILTTGCLRTETGILGKRWQLSSRTIPAIYRAG
jgi:hypothetical protein